MKDNKIKITIITNTILIMMVAVVLSVSFIPEKVKPIVSDNTSEVIYNGNRSNPNVSLMFNVYENTEVVNGIMQELDKRGLKATFFVGGCWADDNEEMLKLLVQNGHEIANHGYFHKDHKKLSYEQNYQEIRLTAEIVKSLCGVQTTLFAPPSGSFGDNTLSASKNLGYKVIMWSKDTIDWRDNSLTTIYNRATKNLVGGDLVLMHPKKHTLEVLPSIIDYYKSVGFDVVCVSQNILGT